MTPVIVTNRAPGIVIADLHTPLRGGASLKPDGSFGAQSTPHSSILKVSAVVGSKWISRTVDESGLGADTLDIVQPDLTSAVRNSSRGKRCGTC